MSDDFQNRADQVSAPATRCAAVTPHDGDALSMIPKGLYVGTGGDVSIEPAGGGGPVTLANVPGGSILPVRARIVRATGTTAADIVALY
ncbi:spike base protein, RCAP_Rcc01079 family [Sphingomonas sp.]|uniref:spike base protein, RCAP_Rcc01079 family n=1 Tax=Sphingomonas sp. TaxID=28214 RepID=UPI002EDAF8BB